jgi:hypothetical protein
MSSLDPRPALRDRLPLLSALPAAPLATRRALRESLPVAALLALWTVLSWVAVVPTVAGAVRTTGAVTALGYVVVRGVSLGADARPLVVADAPGVLGQGVRVALAPGAWFLLALAVRPLAGLWDLLGLVGFFVSPAGDLVRLCARTGLGTALLLVVAGATAALHGRRAGESAPASASTGD